jgi:hypothetical protein
MVTSLVRDALALASLGGFAWMVTTVAALVA